MACHNIRYVAECLNIAAVASQAFRSDGTSPAVLQQLPRRSSAALQGWCSPAAAAAGPLPLLLQFPEWTAHVRGWKGWPTPHK